MVPQPQPRFPFNNTQELPLLHLWDSQCVERNQLELKQVEQFIVQGSEEPSGHWRRPHWHWWHWQRWGWCTLQNKSSTTSPSPHTSPHAPRASFTPEWQHPLDWSCLVPKPLQHPRKWQSRWASQRSNTISMECANRHSMSHQPRIHGRIPETVLSWEEHHVSCSYITHLQTWRHDQHNYSWG